MRLEIGYQGIIEVREAHINPAIPNGFTLLYLSDLHLNRFSARLIHNIMAIIERSDPDLILLGGDYLDSRKGVPHLTALLQYLQARQNVLAIAGNHDYFYGIDGIRNLLAQHGVQWIEKSSAICNIKGCKVQIDNVLQPSETPIDCHIRCLHQPVDMPNPNPYHLIVAGHLHGSQFVFWQNERGLYPGRWFYRWNILEKKLGDALYLVSKGLGDTLPLRYNCKRDVLLVRVGIGTEA